MVSQYMNNKIRTRKRKITLEIWYLRFNAFLESSNIFNIKESSKFKRIIRYEISLIETNSFD